MHYFIFFFFFYFQAGRKKRERDNVKSIHSVSSKEPKSKLMP